MIRFFFVWFLDSELFGSKILFVRRRSRSHFRKTKMKIVVNVGDHEAECRDAECTEYIDSCVADAGLHCIRPENIDIRLSALVDGVAAGTLMATHTAENSTYVCGIHVHEHFRRLGIGTLLMKKIEEICEESGRSELHLSAVNPALNFYRAMRMFPLRPCERTEFIKATNLIRRRKEPHFFRLSWDLRKVVKKKRTCRMNR